MKPRHALTLLPLALSMVGGFRSPATTTTTAPPRVTRGAQLAFSVPLASLRQWAGPVVEEIDDVEIGGHSGVHAPSADCEMHFGAHSSAYDGSPNGLILEPMNVCSQPPPQGFNKWIAFGDSLVDQSVTAFGVPRIWPEHLNTGKDDPSNPDHAAEVHPLTSLTFGSSTYDFAANVFAGPYKGGVKETTAFKMLQNIAVSVTRNGASADIGFSVGMTPGNFTVLTLVIDRTSLADDGAGSLRGNAEVMVDDTPVTVYIVTAKGSPVNDELKKIKSGAKDSVTEAMLVLFSLSPQALLDAATKSNGDAVDVDQPIQLILYGPPTEP